MTPPTLTPDKLEQDLDLIRTAAEYVRLERAGRLEAFWSQVAAMKSEPGHDWQRRNAVNGRR